MRMRCFTLVPALLIITILPAFAIDCGMILGEVRPKHSGPIHRESPAGLTVVADFSLVNVYQYACTDTNGNFAFTEVPPGTYCVFVDDANYAGTATTATITPGNTEWRTLEARPSLPHIIHYYEARHTDAGVRCICIIVSVVLPPPQLPGKEWVQDYAGTLPGVFPSP